MTHARAPQLHLISSTTVTNHADRWIEAKWDLDRAWRDQTKGAMRSALGLLEERKRALITAVVTGEFDVSTASTRAAAAVTG